MTARKFVSYSLPAILSITILLTGCGGGGSVTGTGGGGTGGGGINPPPSTTNEWAWEGGSDNANAAGVYGTLGVASASNVPGARDSAVSWIDSRGNLWLFGGEIPSTQLNTNVALVNDLWEFSPTAKTWTWISGSSSVPTGTAGSPGMYGTLGVDSASNVPGGRDGSVSWIDSSGNLWLFGGYGVDSTGTGGNLNDLWEFSPATKEWTWVSGSDTANAPGVNGTEGVAAAGNVPSGRSFAVSWIDKSGNFWLFGGSCYTLSATAACGSGTLASSDLNDLWMFNPTAKTWTWVSGSSAGNEAGIYGTLGTASASNVPGGRGDSASWIDNSGNLWLFGGVGLDANGTERLLNDLWEYSPTAKTWTWISGSSTGNAAGIYGTLGTASVSNSPGARNGSVSWTDSAGNLWLFGGDGFDSTGTGSSTGTSLNDLWEFSPAAKTWKWVSGSNLENAAGVYGTLGTASTSSIPGSRYSAVSWIDSSGNLWLFGGETGYSGDLNDLWKYQP